MSLLMWMRAVRDHRPKAGRSARYPVLWALALRMKPDGSGFASVRILAEDVELGESTVRRHIKWARDTGYLVRTRRGHRLGDGTVIASEYRLTQPLTTEQLTDVSTAQLGTLNRSDNGSQPLSPDGPRESSTRESSSSIAAARQTAPAAQDEEEDPRPDGRSIDDLTRYIFELINEAAPKFEDIDEPWIQINDPEIQPYNAEMAKRLIAGIDRDFQPRNLRAYLRKMAEAGDLFPRWERIEEDVLSERREQLKAERAVELAAAPDCHHGTPNGTGPNITTGFRQCPLCRAEEVEARRSA